MVMMRGRGSAVGVGKIVTKLVLWVLVVLAVVWGSLFLAIGIWKTYEIGQDINQAKSLQKDLGFVIKEFQDLYQAASTLAVPNACNVSLAGLEQPDQYKDSEFRIFSGSFNDTSIRFDAGAIDPDSTTVITMRNFSGVVAYKSDIDEQEAVFHDDTFYIYHVNDTTRRIFFDLGNLSPGTTRAVSFQPRSGIIAYLSDIVTFTTAFPDDEFEIVGAADSSKAFVFDVSAVSTDTTQTLSVQNTSGVVAYTTDVPWEVGVYSDSEFVVYAESDIDRQGVFNLGDISAATTIDMQIQSRSGDIAYLSDTNPAVTVDILTSRQFPSNAVEGFSSFQAGKITTIQIWMCGGGGSGMHNCFRKELVANYYHSMIGGGSGGAIDGLILPDVSRTYSHFDITVGQGGRMRWIVTINRRFKTAGGVGGTTSIIGVPLDSSNTPLELYGYGGGPGNTESSVPEGVQYGGCGGGSGGSPITSGDISGSGVQTAGVAGVSGVSGVCGDLTNEMPINSKARMPWRGGSHGSAAMYDTELGGWFLACNTNLTCPASHMIGAYKGGDQSSAFFYEQVFAAEGGGGLFGRGGDGTTPSPAAGSCAGGGGVQKKRFCGNIKVGTRTSFSRGGSGRVVIRYWTSE